MSFSQSFRTTLWELNLVKPFANDCRQFQVHPKPPKAHNALWKQVRHWWATVNYLVCVNKYDEGSRFRIYVLGFFVDAETDQPND